MRKLTAFMIIFILIFSSGSATAYGQLYSLIESAQSLLFCTDNVTLSGHADFSLDGKHFKKADILYQQDGFNSLWQLDLLTPRPNRTNLHTGYTVIANGTSFFAIEHYTPGVYKSGIKGANNTVLRRSVQSDHLVSMALSMADLLETLLPTDTLRMVFETKEYCELDITISGNSLPAFLNSFLNLAAEFALDRFMGTDYDHVNSLLNDSHRHIPFDDFDTVTRAILYCTDHFTLSNAAVRLRLDANKRLETMFGAVSVLLSVPGEEDRLLDISFDLIADEYGSTTVSAFEPDRYQVVPADSDNMIAPEPDPSANEL